VTPKTSRQGGGAATQMPAEHYHSGSNPDLGFCFLEFLAKACRFYIVVIIHQGLLGVAPPPLGFICYHYLNMVGYLDGLRQDYQQPPGAQNKC
jgi:hypothetical protein